MTNNCNIYLYLGLIKVKCHGISKHNVLKDIIFEVFKENELIL